MIYLKLFLINISEKKKKIMSRDSDTSSDSSEEETKKRKKSKKEKKEKKEKRRKDKKKKKKKKKDKKEKDKLKEALRKEVESQKEAERLLKMDEKHRPYNSMYTAKEPTKEEKEAYQIKRMRDGDPMSQFL